MIGTRCGLAAIAACAAVAAVALCGGIAACGSSGGSSSPSATNAAATASPGTDGAASGNTTGASGKTSASGKTGASGKTTATGATATAAAASTGLTAPGTKLSVGQSATVAFTPAGAHGNGKSSTLLVTVRSIEKGSLSDFNGIQLDASQKASTPYYVKVHVTNLGPHAIDVDGSAAAIEGVDDTGNNQQSVTFIGTFPRRPDSASTAPLGTGRGYGDCLTFLVPGGITKVSYNGTTDYIDAPVTWTPN